MCGCRISLRMCISRETLSTSVTSTILSFSRIFMATFSPTRVCLPSFTLPKVPSPIVLPIQNIYKINIGYIVIFKDFASLNILFLLKLNINDY